MKRWDVFSWLTLAVFILLVALVVGLLVGCTVTPDVVKGVDGYVGNAQNSGVIASAAQGVQVTAAAIAKYRALVGRYGKGLPDHLFLPALTASAGVQQLPDGSYLLDREHFADWALMATWARSGRSP